MAEISVYDPSREIRYSIRGIRPVDLDYWFEELGTHLFQLCIIWFT